MNRNIKEKADASAEKPGKISRIVWAVLPLLLSCLYPCAFQWLTNADEALAADMFPMLWVFLLIAVLAFAVSALILRGACRAGFYSSVFMLAFANAGLLSESLKAHFSWMHDRYLLILLALLMVLLLVLLLRHRGFPAKEFCQILTVFFGFLLIFRFVTAAPTLWSIVTAERKEPAIDPAEVTLEGEKPNVYYILSDEYGGLESLREYYDYDNMPFLNTLSSLGFNNSLTSRNTESVYTWAIVPNILNLDYVVNDDVPHLVKHEYMDTPVLQAIFAENGYQVNLINHQNFFSAEGCNVLTGNQSPEGIGDYIYDNSLLELLPGIRNPLRVRLGLSTDATYISELREVFDLMENCTDYVGDEPTLTLIYAQCPHFLFVFDENGNPRYQGTFDFLDKSGYLGLLKYYNTILEETVSNIIEKDPEAIIVLQSDHGARYPIQIYMRYGEPEVDMEKDVPIVQNILNSVYVGGRQLDIEGLSSINTLRTILNEEFGTDFPMLEQPTGYTSDFSDWR